MAPTTTPSAIAFVTEQTFERDVMTSELPVLIEFCTSWSVPCKQMEPDLTALAHELAGKAKVLKADVERSPQLAQEFQVKSVPTFAVVHQGRLVGQPQPGALRRAQLRAMIESVLPRSESALRIEEFLQLAKTGRVVAVDTRDAGSFSRAHVPGAINLPIADLETKMDALASTGRAPVLYCRSGVDTKAFAERLSEQGYPVAFLEGGFLAWELAGQPIERGGATEA